MIIKYMILSSFFLLKSYIIVALNIDVHILLLMYLILIAFIDLNYKLIPNYLIGAMIIDFLVIVDLNILISRLVIFIIIGLILISIYYYNKEIFYGGDIKLISTLGLYLGVGVIQVLILTGIINIIFHITFNKREIPLGPSVLLATMILWSG
ncbi:MAG: prepilin peptidase [Halanaerobiales bacterium]